MIDAKLFLARPITFGQIKVYPPLVGEVINEQYFSSYKEFLTLTRDELSDLLEKNREREPELYKGLKEKDLEVFLDPFLFLLYHAKKDKNFEQQLKQAFKFFLKEEVEFFYEEQMILIGKLENELLSLNELTELVFIEQDNFFIVQNLIRKAIGQKEIQKIDYEDDNPMVRRMKMKARERDRVKEKKEKGISMGTLLAGVCCMGIGLTPLNIEQISYKALMMLFGMNQQKEEHALDMQILSSGMSKQKTAPKYWIRDEDD
jgi:hypothetical protein